MEAQQRAGAIASHEEYIAGYSSLTPTVSNLDDQEYFCFVSVYSFEPNHYKAFFVPFNTSFSDFDSTVLTKIKSQSS